MAWLVKKNKLGYDQLSVLEEIKNDIRREKKNIWIKGFPGSGKSVLLAYALQEIKYKNPDASIVMVVFTHSLINMYEAAFKEINVNVNVITYFQFARNTRSYDYIFVDEVQDLPRSILQEIKNRGNYVIVAGDENQSIYDKAPKTDEPIADPSEISLILNTENRVLSVIYRLSNSIISVVNKFLPKLNIFKAKVSNHPDDTDVRLCKAKTLEEEVKYVLGEAKEAVAAGYTVGVLFPTHAMIKTFVKLLLNECGCNDFEFSDDDKKIDYSSLNRYFRKNGIPFQYVGNGIGRFEEHQHVVYIMTYHSSKGIDFNKVFLPFMGANWYVVADCESRRKAVFMVAMTRSRGDLYLVYHGIPHEYVVAFMDKCFMIDVHETLVNGNNNSSFSSEDNDFGI